MEDSMEIVNELMKSGSAAFRAEKYQEAVPYYLEAWEAVPEPKEEWDGGDSLWLTVFRSYSRMKDHQKALQALKKAQSCYRGDVNSRIHFLLGQMYFDEFDNKNLAAEHFNKAWDLSEGRAFQGEDPKYVKFARGK